MTRQEITPSSLQRNEMESLRHRAHLLEGQDKVLMLMYLDNGNSFRQMAELLGVCHQTISRKIHRLIRHIAGQPFQIYKRHRKKFNKVQKDFARDYLLNGLSMRQIAAKNQCSFYQVRKIMTEIKKIVSRD